MPSSATSNADPTWRGSATPELIRQSSEGLAGRLLYLELTEFLLSEAAQAGTPPSHVPPSRRFPPKSSGRLRRRKPPLETELHSDVSGTGYPTARRLDPGQVLNQSQLGGALGVSHTTVRSYMDLLSRAFMLRLLPFLESNTLKRTVKSPLLYVRDSGILRAAPEAGTPAAPRL
jgi:uncharacterized protein